MGRRDGGNTARSRICLAWVQERFFCPGLTRCCPAVAVMDVGYGPARAGQEPHTPSPHRGLEQAGTADLTLHIEKDGGVVGLAGGRVGQGAVELVVGVLASEGEDAGSVRSREVDFLFLTVEVPGQCGTGDWPGNPAGEDTTLPLLQGARCSWLPISGGVQFLQCCQRAHDTSELWQESCSQSCTRPHPSLTCHAERQETEQQ